MTNPFTDAPAQELLAALETAGRTAPLELIRACMSRRHDLTAGLLDMLATQLDENWAPDDARWYAPIHAGHLLIFFREPAAIPIFMRLLRDPQSEHLFDWFGTKLASYGLGILGPLSDLLNDTDAPEVVRMSTTATFEQLVAEFPTERARVIEILRRALPPLDKNGALDIPKPKPSKPSIVWTAIATTLAVFADFGSRPQIEALYRDKWMDESFLGDEKDYIHTLLHPKPLHSEAFNLMETYEQLLDEGTATQPWDKSSISELQRQLHELNAQGLAAPEPDADEPEAAKSPAAPPIAVPAVKDTAARRPPASSAWAVPKPVQPVRRDTPKIGRNDPCFCGSGRKYKHCHGKA